MAAPSSARVLAKFDRFTANLSSGEVHRDGVRVPFQEKPFQVLRLLLEAEGRVVTREQLRSALWPEDTFVDFDLGVNTGVKKVRQALGDSADRPKFVETLPKIGYRFLVPIAWETEPGNADAASFLTPAITESSAIAVPGGGVAVPAKRGSLIIGVAIAIAVFAGAFLLYLWTRPPKIPSVSSYFQVTRDGHPKFLIGTDGTRLYLRLNLPGQPVGEVSVFGGDPKPIAVPSSPEMLLLSVKPDGSELLVATRRDPPNDGLLCTLPVLGGSPRPVGNLRGRVASWSPDGRRLAYGLKGDVFLANADGTDSHRIASLGDENMVLTPAWSPDGQHLQFSLAESGNGMRSLWQVALDGKDLRRVIPAWNTTADSHCCGRWTADGKYLLFEYHTQIWGLRREELESDSTPTPFQLTSSPMSLSFPLPSKDGKKLFVIGYSDRGELVRFDARSGQFSPYLRGICAEYIDFSRDGQWVAYVTYPEGILWRSRIDGSEAYQLTYPPERAMLPRWSPDGKQIAFYEFFSGKPTKVLEVSAIGGTPHALMPADSGFQEDPGWSPDGNRIVFGGVAGDPASSIRIYDRNAQRIATLSGSQGFSTPRWSPDGRYIAALAQDQKTLMLYDWQTERWRELASEVGSWPVFSRDGKFIYLLGEHVTAGVYRVRVNDALVERVADLKDFKMAGHLNKSLALAPDDSLILLRDIGTQDIYALDWH